MKNQLTGVRVESSFEQDAVTAVYVRLKDIIGYILTNDTGWSRSTFTYNEAICRRDVGFVIDAVRYDMMFGGNFRTITAAKTYYSAQAALVLSVQKAATISAFTYLRNLLVGAITGATEITSVTNNMNELLDITSLTAEQGITLYPNPSTDEIRIQQLVSPASYTIYDMFGKIQQKGTTANNQTISLKSLMAGSYLMLIETDGKQLKKSFVKR
jgi:hypothetical protein